MEILEKEYKKLRFGLAFKKVMDQNKDNDPLKKVNDDATSFRKIEKASGIRHASIVQIINGKKNASWSTIDAIIEGLEMTLTQFAVIYDALTQEEVEEHKKEIERKKQQRNKKKISKSKLAEQSISSTEQKSSSKKLPKKNK